jgi:hypothetical protein
MMIESSGSYSKGKTERSEASATMKIKETDLLGDFSSFKINQTSRVRTRLNLSSVSA